MCDWVNIRTTNVLFNIDMLDMLDNPQTSEAICSMYSSTLNVVLSF
jgi:hypothetical protein